MNSPPKRQLSLAAGNIDDAREGHHLYPRGGQPTERQLTRKGEPSGPIVGTDSPGESDARFQTKEAPRRNQVTRYPTRAYQSDHRRTHAPSLVAFHPLEQNPSQRENMKSRSGGMAKAPTWSGFHINRADLEVASARDRTIGSPVPARNRATLSGFFTSAMSFNRPLHFGHSRTSTANVRRGRRAASRAGPARAGDEAHSEGAPRDPPRRAHRHALPRAA